ncbi:MAG: tripartite tricarboxylate transporter permease [Actinomycetia bacterium]|nr:tripartite tricarboxylate transporter permease [Actinomycetes bacterium]
MTLLEGLTSAADLLLSWPLLLFFLFGTLYGLIFGILPGLSGSVGIALMIPLTFGIDISEAIVLFTAALSGQTFAGSITAILLNTPGTAPNAATTFDGYQLSRQGKAGFAVGISAMASSLGSLVGVVVLVVLLPAVRVLILSFSYPEFMLLALMGLAAIAAASRGSLIKGLIAGGVGVMLAFVGLGSWGQRYVFNTLSLIDGVDVIAVLIGLFAISEVVRLLKQNRPISRVGDMPLDRSQVWEGMWYVIKKPFLLIRSALVGTGLGIVPAVGGTVASFMAYYQAMHTTKDGKFGRGDPRGVLAPEAANDGKDAGAALPTLAFGLPGSSDWAIILGAMVLYGVVPGPNLLRERPDIVWIAIIVILAASWVTSAIGIAASRWLVPVTKVRPSLLAPIVAVLALVGSFGLERQFVDVMFTVGFGILGYYMKIHRMPVVPLILGLLLGAEAERSFHLSMNLFDQGLLVFLTRPISLVLLAVTATLLVGSIWSVARRRKKMAAEAEVVIAPAEMGLVAFIGAVMLLATLYSYTFPANEGRLFPQVVGWGTVALVLIFLVVAKTPVLRYRWGYFISEELIHFDASQEEETDEQDTIEVESEDVQARRERALLLSLFGFLAVAWLGGLNLVAVPLYVLVLMRWFGREKWRTSVIAAIVTTGMIWFMINFILSSPIHWGLLLEPLF